LQKSCNHDVVANFSLRVFFVFSALQTQAEACGYQNRTFARASIISKLHNGTGIAFILMREKAQYFRDNNSIRKKLRGVL